MHRRLLVACLGLGFIGCGGDNASQVIGNPVNVFDLSMARGTDVGDMTVVTGDSPDLAMSNAKGCNGVYSQTTIAQMRQAAMTGCVELDNVVSIATSPVSATSTSIRIVVQDAAGGDYSAINVSCSSKSTSHPCTAFSVAKNILAGRSVTVQGTYFKGSASKGGYELLDLDSITDNASGTAPAPQMVALADIERSANKTAYWFQKVTLSIASTDALKMYDFSPAEFKSSTSTTACGSYYGFGMLPKSATGTAGAACSGTTQPAALTTVNANEVLFGTDFHGGFTANSECGCISTKTMKPFPGLLSAASTLSGTVSGILFYDASAATGYQYLSPLTTADAPITNTSM